MKQLDSDDIIDKILRLNERNLELQATFNEKLIEFRNTLASTDRSIEEISSDVSDIFKQLNELYTIINHTTNKQIFEMVQIILNDKQLLVSDIKSIYSQISNIVKNCNENANAMGLIVCHDAKDEIKRLLVQMDTFETRQDTMAKEVSEIKKLYNVAIGVITAATILISSIQIGFKLIGADSETGGNNKKIEKKI